MNCHSCRKLSAKAWYLVCRSNSRTPSPSYKFNNARLFYFSNVEKEALVTQVFNKDGRQIETNYIPTSVLNVFYKIFEKFPLPCNQMQPLNDNLMSSFLSACQSRYGTQHVLLRLTEQ